MLKTRWVFGLACLALPSACADTPEEPNEERGELGRGTFSYECFGATDLACRTGSPAFPSAVAVGGRFRVEYDPSKGPSPVVIPASSDSIAALPGGFQVLRPGYAALLAVDSSRRVQDLVHVRGATIDEVWVAVDGGLPATKVRVGVGSARVLSAVPVDVYEVALAGALPYEWRSEDPSLVELETLESHDQVQIRGVSAGMTELLVSVGDLEFALPVEVTAGAAPLPVEPEPDAGTQPEPFEPPSDGADAGRQRGPDAGSDAPLDAGLAEDGDAARPPSADGGVPELGLDGGTP